MNELITWAAKNNTLLIQVAFSVVLLLILIYIYRLFFVANPHANLGESAVELGEVNQKLNQLLDQQKNSGIQVIEKVVPAAAPTGATAPTGGDDVAVLRAEIIKLQTQLNESEKKVFELTPIAGPEDSIKEEAPKVDPAQITELNKKIEELQSRLSEYDIIADDIAELSQLRAENAELKKNLGGASGLDSLLGAVPQATPEATPEAVVDAPAEAAVIESVVEPLAEPEVETLAPPIVELPELDIALDTSAELETALAEATAALPDIAAPAPIDAAIAEPLPEVVSEVQEKIVMDQNIPETEKNLINEFEKSTQKGS